MSSFADVFRAEAGTSGKLRFDRFVDLALYHPECGYYAGNRRQRVGLSPQTDFYTASSIPLFGEAIAAAAAALVGGADAAGNYHWVEIGAEAGRSVLDGLPQPFASARSIALGETLDLSGKCIVFSNELFDAQPFRRFRFADRIWSEIWVAADGDPGDPPAGEGGFAEVLHPVAESSIAGKDGPIALPSAAALEDAGFSSYSLDAPVGAARLARAIARLPWQGLFLAADYGKSWDELSLGTPVGTARAYHHHRQSNDLLAHPGEQDLTCHICWDWMAEELKRFGFESAVVEPQEKFFVEHASGLLEAVTSASATGTDLRKRQLMQLLHPSLMGRKFQVLRGLRPTP